MRINFLSFKDLLLNSKNVISGFSRETIAVFDLVAQFLVKIDHSLISNTSYLEFSNHQDLITVKLYSASDKCLNLSIDVFNGFIEVFVGNGLELLLAHRFKKEADLKEFLRDCFCSAITVKLYRNKNCDPIKEELEFFRRDKKKLSLTFRTRWALFSKSCVSKREYSPWIDSNDALNL